MKLFSLSKLKNYLAANRKPKSSVCRNEPARICLFLTDRCTLSCKWCLRQSASYSYLVKTRQDMSFEQAKRILQYFPKATHLSLAGFGEPLLVNDIFKINAEFNKRPMRTNIITNGTLLQERINDVLQAGFYYVSISLNSLNSKEYELTCGSGQNTFNNIINGILSLTGRRRYRKPYVYISFVLTRDLFNRTTEIIKLAEELKVDRLNLHNLITHHDYTGVLTTDDDEVVAKLSEWKRKEYKVQVGWPRLVQKNLKKPLNICKFLWIWLGVDMDGNTAGCHRALGTDKDYGNLFSEGKEVWNNKYRKNLRSSFLHGNEFLMECCKSCVETQPLNFPSCS